MTSLDRARWLALAIPAALLGGAYASQYVGGLYPCEMCHWQRWPHMAAIVLAVAALALRQSALSRPLILLAAVAIAVSGAIGVFHAGVEYGWWQGVTGCAAPMSATNAEDMLAEIMATPLIRCDVAQWTLAGVSLAGFNAIFSLGGALAVLVLATRRGS
ncbi:disulfide bond formation protein B [Sphingomonas gilva]|uniref:Disulfide bond formation protein B n=1 Tax=Sphingomonas gilva TaxID=2305907 RepID=A0A396RR70_9SPHN|nr:disulfide bond formation protein B [Sphingomonas gilva]RHW16783.1 disulfide bond formation protein B [Sphingomonas gilva]